MKFTSKSLKAVRQPDELDALRYFVPFMPVTLRADMPPLVEAWARLPGP